MAAVQSLQRRAGAVLVIEQRVVEVEQHRAHAARRPATGVWELCHS
jgi:hypothetical protein